VTMTVRVDDRDLRVLRRVRGKARATITLTWTAGGKGARRRLAVTLPS
jgi:hypothetical protein